MCDYKKMTNEIVKYIFGILLTCIGFLIASAYNRTNLSLVQLSADIIQLRIDVSEINAKMLTDDRVREICRDEIHKTIK